MVLFTPDLPLSDCMVCEGKDQGVQLAPRTEKGENSHLHIHGHLGVFSTCVLAQLSLQVNTDLRRVSCGTHGVTLDKDFGSCKAKCCMWCGLCGDI